MNLLPTEILPTKLGMLSLTSPARVYQVLNSPVEIFRNYHSPQVTKEFQFSSSGPKIPQRLKILYSPSRMKTLILSSSQDNQMFSNEDLLKTRITEDWYTTQTPNSPSVVNKDVSSSAIKILAIPCSSQGFTFSDSSQDSIISGHPGSIYPQQDSLSAYMRIHLHSYHKH